LSAGPTCSSTSLITAFRLDNWKLAISIFWFRIAQPFAVRGGKLGALLKTVLEFNIVTKLARTRGSSQLVTRETFRAPILVGGGYKKKLDETRKKLLSPIRLGRVCRLPPSRYFPKVI
jgi:hypothetical protein